MTHTPENRARSAQTAPEVRAGTQTTAPLRAGEALTFTDGSGAARLLERLHAAVHTHLADVPEEARGRFDFLVGNDPGAVHTVAAAYQATEWSSAGSGGAQWTAATLDEGLGELLRRACGLIGPTPEDTARQIRSLGETPDVRVWVTPTAVQIWGLEAGELKATQAAAAPSASSAPTGVPHDPA